MRQQIPLNEIVVAPQPRKTFDGIEQLAASIREHGLLQPLVVDENKLLCYGERRYRACKLLGLEMVDVVFEKQMSEDERAERQLVENIQRQALTWQEEALGVLDVYRKKKRRGALEGWTWGQRQASEMFGMALGTINYVLIVAQRLEKELCKPPGERKYHAFTSVAEAYRIGILGEQEDLLNAELARRAQEEANRKKVETEKAVAELVKEIDSTPVQPNNPSIISLREKAKGNYLDLSKDEALELYKSNPLNPAEKFDEYYNEKRELLAQHLTIDLSNILIHGDCIEYLRSHPNSFDHIITDPPYAIDMSMLAQENQGMVDINRVEDAHHVDENLSLLTEFFPAAFTCIKETGFLVLCCDIMVWQHLYNNATNAGFAVQRWPIVWRKVNQPVGNNAAQYNTTKDFEIIMVCRKPKTVVVNKLNTSIIEASNVEATKLTGHPFAKPFELTAKLLDAFTTEGQTILEPFAGGGSMVIQMLRSNRKVVGVEKELHHYNSLLENVKQQYYLKLNPKFIFK